MTLSHQSTKQIENFGESSPEAGKDAAFVNRFGVLPFDITAPESFSDDYAGTHTIRWYDLDFPVDGNYNIEVAVDDNVNLRFINKNGEETSIEKKRIHCCC